MGKLAGTLQLTVGDKQRIMHFAALNAGKRSRLIQTVARAYLDGKEVMIVSPDVNRARDLMNDIVDIINEMDKVYKT